MGRSLRTQAGGLVYHVLNRANRRLPLFTHPSDYTGFLRTLAEAQVEQPMRLLAYCLMPNHWHLLLWPEHDRQLSRFVGWLTLTHTQRWHAARGTAGLGHLYQGRFKSFPVESDEHFLTVCRYVERNALRAGLVARAEDWLWSSLGQPMDGRTGEVPVLSAGPVPWPKDWMTLVNATQTVAEEGAVRRCIQRGQPYGSAAWVERTVATFGLHRTQRCPGRPRKPGNPNQRLLFEENGS